MRGQFTNVKVDNVPVQSIPGEETAVLAEPGDSVRGDFEVIADPGDELNTFRAVSALDSPAAGWSAGRHIRVMDPVYLADLEDLGLISYDREGRRVSHAPVIADGMRHKLGTDYQDAIPGYLRAKFKAGSGVDVGDNATDPDFGSIDIEMAE